MEVNNFFSKPDLGDVDPEVFRASLELANLKNKIKEFGKYLIEASKSESSEGLEAEYWATKYNKHFEITEVRDGQA